MFCKKVNIPYEVYAFTSEHDEPYCNEYKEGDINLRGFKLLNMLSSKMTAAEFSYAGAALVNMCSHRQYRPNWLQKGGTPLSEGIISAMTIVPHFQKQYKFPLVFFQNRNKKILVNAGKSQKKNTRRTKRAKVSPKTIPCPKKKTYVP